MERLNGAHELLDGRLDGAELRANLRDLARVNRWLGGLALSWRALGPLLERANGGPVTLLDVGTGAGDIPLALIERARRNGTDLRVVAIDLRPEIAALARRNTAHEPALTVATAPAGRLAYEDAAFDIVHASLLLHHHEPEEAAKLLAESRRVCRRGVIVNDLERARRFWLGAWLLSRVATRNRYTRHDAPLSVRRAYTAAEVEQLARVAGLHVTARFRDRLGHRYALLLEPVS